MAANGLRAIAPTLHDCACATLPPELAAETIAWCKYTENTNVDFISPTCDVLAGHRYVELAGSFVSHVIGSACSDPETIATDLLDLIALNPPAPRCDTVAE